MQEREVLLGGHLLFGGVKVAALIHIGHPVMLVDFRHGRKVEVLLVETYHAVFIDGMPLALIDDAVAESVEATLADIVPSHLMDSLGFLCLAVDEGFQHLVFLLPLEETEVALAFYLLLEPLQFCDILLLELNGATRMAVILQFKDTAGLDIISDEEERLDDEVGPWALTALRIQVVVMVATPVEVVTLELLGFFVGLTTFQLLSPAGSICKCALPHSTFAVFALQVCEQGGLEDVRLDIDEHIANVADDLQLFVIGAFGIIVLLSVPEDEVFLR